MTAFLWARIELLAEEYNEYFIHTQEMGVVCKILTSSCSSLFLYYEFLLGVDYMPCS